jgi:uncharacterized protein (TIGR02266 family)
MANLQSGAKKTTDRSKPRFAANLEVLIYSKGLDTFFAEKTANISLGGLFVCTPLTASVGDKLHIRVILSDIDSYFEVKSKVVWVCPAGKPHPQGLGLEFVELSQAQKTVIEKILSKYIHEDHS